MQKTILDPAIKEMLKSLRTYDLGDIEKTKDAGMPIAAFILGTCFIDHLSRIRFYKYGLKDKYRFEKFVNDFLPHEYKGFGKNLYTYLRSTLVHNYSVKGKFYLEYVQSSNHLHLDPNGRIYLNIHNFAKDLGSAFHIFEQILINDVGDTRENAMAHNKEYPILTDKSI